MTDLKKAAIAVATTMAALTFAGATQAATYTIDFRSPSSTTSGVYTYGYDDGASVSITGLSATNSNSANSGKIATSAVSNSYYNSYYYSHYYGLQVNGNGHGISNSGRYEAVLLDFGQAVSLDSIGIGYTYYDADASILAYTGSDYSSIVGNRWSALTSLGFEHAVDYNSFFNLSAYSTTNVGSSLVSQYWLISAYNSVFGGTNDSRTDTFKLTGLTFSTIDVEISEVPVPAALGLFLSGLAGMGYMRRRKNTQAQATA